MNQPERIEAVVFDIGGVLEITPETGWPERWAKKLEVDPRDFEARLEAILAPGEVGEATLEQIERSIARDFVHDAPLSGRLMDYLWAEYLGAPNAELMDYFGRLRPRVRTALLSNSFVGAREREEAAYGFAELCELIVYSHEEGCAKPDPRIYRAVCDRLGVAPESTVFVDDLEPNVEGAQGVGMNGVLYRSNEELIAELDALLGHQPNA